MFQRRSSQRTSSKASLHSTIFLRMSCSFSPRVRILILDSSSLFNHTAPTGVHSEPPTDNEAPSDPQGQMPDPLSYPLSKINATKLNGGTVKIVDSTTFKISTRIAVADVTVEPGALRELHVRVRVLLSLLWWRLPRQWHVVASDTGRVALCTVTTQSHTSRDRLLVLRLGAQGGQLPHDDLRCFFRCPHV